eukprot:1582516-Pyramimonas_sp.AAC.1
MLSADAPSARGRPLTSAPPARCASRPRRRSGALGRAPPGYPQAPLAPPPASGPSPPTLAPA